MKSPHFRGYTRIGGERTQGKVDWREQIDIGPEREAIDDPDAPDFARLIGPNLWPEAQPELQRGRHGVARAPDGRRPQAAAGVGPGARRTRGLLRRALRRAVDAHQDRALPRQERAGAAAGRRRPQGFGRAHAAVGRAGQGRAAGGARRRVGRCPVRARRVRREHRRTARVRDAGLPEGDEPPGGLAPLPGRPHLGAVLLQPGARPAAADHRAAGGAGGRGDAA